MTSSKVYKLVLVGDSGVGKTTWCKRLLTGEFEKEYVATLGVERHNIKIGTNDDEIIFDVWDISGREKFIGPRDGYYMGADCCIFMYDDSKRSYLNLHEKWIPDVKNTCGKIPFVMVQNKVELSSDSSSSIGVKISTKTYYQPYHPLLLLAQQLMAEPTSELEPSS